MSRRLALAFAMMVLSLHAPMPGRALVVAAAGQDTSDDQRIRALLTRLERAVQSPDASAYLALQTASADRNGAQAFAAAEFRPGATRAVIQERDRMDLPGVLAPNGYRLIVDAFMESGNRARVATWRLDVKRVNDEWLVSDQLLISAVENLYHLSLNPAKQFDARNFTIRAEDFELTLTEGSVFVAETDQGTTGLVLTGRGDLRFSPAPGSEKEQVKIFSGAEILETKFEAAYIRVGTLSDHADVAALKARPVDPRELRRAEQIFREESAKSFIVDLADLTRDTWSLPPGAVDFLAEIRTRRFETLTYAQSASEAEDISFFERKRHRNIAAYTSKNKLAARGRFYNEDDLVAYDVLDYDIAVTAQPDRLWIDGTTIMHLRVRAPGMSQLNIRIADSLVVRSVDSDQFGRLFGLRVANQNTLLVNLPATLLRDTEMLVTFKYGGRLEPQAPERETVQAGSQRDPQGPPLDLFEDQFIVKPEATYLYSNSTYWYPQSTITDYAVARMQITVPATFGCVASGEMTPESPQTIPARDQTPARRVYTFTTERPLRYLAFAASRFVHVDRQTLAFERARVPEPAPGAAETEPASYDRIKLLVQAHPRQTGRGRELSERLVDVARFYESILGDAPYGAFTLAVIENALPGGHSPGYFAVLNQPLPNSGLTWRNDPAAFANYPEFFLAHEVAHQWWGQAIGWRNYHEQWLSEGFAQYFAAMYAQQFRGDEVFAGVMRQMRRWAIDDSDQGPIFLGYRVGHIKGDGRAYRAIVYNKGAAVLHMLRRLLGDEVFFSGLRRFYAESRYTKVGSDELRLAMEAESKRSLERFFERWVYGSSLPRITFSYKLEPSAAGAGRQDAVLHFEQTGEIFDIPVTVTLQYADRKPVDVVVPVLDRSVDWRIHLEGTLRSIELNRDDGTLAEIVKN